MKLTNENQLMKKKFLITNKSNEDNKPHVLSTKHIKKFLNIKHTDYYTERVLDEFIENCTIGDSWNTEYQRIECIQIKLLLNNTVHEVVLDTTYPHDIFFNEILKRYNVSMEVINAKGPSGWPEVKLMGKKSDLHVIIKLVYEDEHLCRLVKKVSNTQPSS
tara:strand:- start:946 stop:1428 length:483 start_codon:yes stop_codon:yes gene_type:complete